VVFVTHDQVEAMTLADKIVVLNDGRVAQIGTPLEVFERPANQFVATFMGAPSMNPHPPRWSAMVVRSRPAASISPSRPAASTCRPPAPP
jgi:ABC-type sugar transport system ATPase subunit